MHADIGSALITVGASLIVFQLFVYPKIDDAIGPLGAFCSGIWWCVYFFPDVCVWVCCVRAHVSMCVCLFIP